MRIDHWSLRIDYFVTDVSVGRHTVVDTHKPGSDWVRHDCA